MVSPREIEGCHKRTARGADVWWLTVTDVHQNLTLCCLFREAPRQASLYILAKLARVHWLVLLTCMFPDRDEEFRQIVLHFACSLETVFLPNAGSEGFQSDRRSILGPPAAPPPPVGVNSESVARGSQKFLCFPFMRSHYHCKWPQVSLEIPRRNIHGRWFSVFVIGSPVKGPSLPLIHRSRV